MVTAPRLEARQRHVTGRPELESHIPPVEVGRLRLLGGLAEVDNLAYAFDRADSANAGAEVLALRFDRLHQALETAPDAARVRGAVELLRPVSERSEERGLVLPPLATKRGLQVLSAELQREFTSVMTTAAPYTLDAYDWLYRQASAPDKAGLPPPNQLRAQGSAAVAAQLEAAKTDPTLHNYVPRSVGEHLTSRKLRVEQLNALATALASAGVRVDLPVTTVVRPPTPFAPKPPEYRRHARGMTH